MLDSTVLIGYLRGTPSVASGLRERLGDGHTLATTCVNLAEVERVLRLRERRRAAAFLDGLRFLITDREAPDVLVGTRPSGLSVGGRYTADALIAGTARAHGAVLLTHNLDGFPMRDLRVEAPDQADG